MSEGVPVEEDDNVVAAIDVFRLDEEKVEDEEEEEEGTVVVVVVMVVLSGIDNFEERDLVVLNCGSSGSFFVFERLRLPIIIYR